MTATTICFCHSCIGLTSGRTPEEAQCAHCGAPTGEPRAAHWIAYACSEACQRALDDQEAASAMETAAEEALAAAEEAAATLLAAYPGGLFDRIVVEIPWLRALHRQGMLRPVVEIARERAVDLLHEVNGLATCPEGWNGVAEARAILGPARRLATNLGVPAEAL